MTDATAWSAPPPQPEIAGGQVHVWRVALNPPAPTLARLWPTLTPDEQQRAERFHFQRDRDHFIAARGALRAILARYLRAEPGLLRFSYSSYGKPDLAHGAGDPPLTFNLSHAHELALIAVARGRLLGVDIEWVRPDMSGEEIAERFFSPREVAALRAVPPPQRHEAFFNCWTRKEAYIKARGEGLSHPLDQFDVSLAPGEPAALLGTRGDPAELARWSLQALAPGPGYVAALAAERPPCELRRWQW